MERVGLLLFTAIFLWGAYQQLFTPGQFVDMARRAGVPAAVWLVRLNGLALLAATVAFQLPEARVPAAVVLAVQLPVMTWIAHRFWTFEPGPMRITNRNHFLKNLSLLGAVIAIAAASR